MLRDTAIILAITALLMCAVELVVRAFWPQNTRTTYISGTSLGLKDRVLGHVNRPGVQARVTSPEFSVVYRINAQGFRDTATYSAAKPAGSVRILVLGDSFAQGSANHYDDIWPVTAERALRARGRNTEVIKAGVFGYDTRTELLYLQRLYDRYHPDIVVFTFVFHDLFTNAPTDAPDRAGDAVRSHTSKKSEWHSLTLAKRALMANDAAYMRLYLASGRDGWFSRKRSAEAQRQLEITRTLFLNASRFCNIRGCDLAALSIPQLFQLVGTDSGVDRSQVDLTWVDDDLGRVAARDGFIWKPLLPDLARAYRLEGKDLYHRFDGHLNANGNRIVSAAAVNMLDTLIVKRNADQQ